MVRSGIIASPYSGGCGAPHVIGKAAGGMPQRSLGKWNTTGQQHEGPVCPAAKIVATDTYEWAKGEFFTVHRFCNKAMARCLPRSAPTATSKGPISLRHLLPPSKAYRLSSASAESNSAAQKRAEWKGFFSKLDRIGEGKVYETQNPAPPGHARRERRVPGCAEQAAWGGNGIATAS